MNRRTSHKSKVPTKQRCQGQRDSSAGEELTAKPEDPSLIPRAQMIEGVITSYELHTCAEACVYSHKHTYTDTLHKINRKVTHIFKAMIKMPWIIMAKNVDW